MKIQQFRQSFVGKLIEFCFIFLAITGMFYWLVAEDWTKTAIETKTISHSMLLPANGIIEQQFSSEMDSLTEIRIMPHFDNAERAGNITLTICENDSILWQQSMDASALLSDQQNAIAVQPNLKGMTGKNLRLMIDPQGTGMALWSGSTINTGRFDVVVETSGLSVNGSVAEGALVMSAYGYRLLHSAKYIWPVALILLLAIIGISVKTRQEIKVDRKTPLTKLLRVYQQYRYLIKQLVSRDFHVKYKSSSLGMAWSFLNPLLTMAVYLFVFSTLFRSDIQYFPVYLMSGIVLFNFFSEATSLGMGAIVGNSHLITKVYMPKIIYPLSKVLSASINLYISFIPLLIVMVITGVPLTKSLLLLPVVVMFLLIFSLGVSLILATLNVFFRDTQFLWSVLLTMLSFLTPVFYPESIIPEQFLTLYHINPMYQILFFMRSIVIGGVSPTAITYFYCLLASVIPLLIGLWIFRKNQDKFVLHL